MSILYGRKSFQVLFGLIGIAWCATAHHASAQSVLDYGARGNGKANDTAAIQSAIDANPGKMIFLPAGDFITSAAIRIFTDQTGLYGPGTIIQTNPAERILEITTVTGVRVKDLTLTRPAGKQETEQQGIYVGTASDVVLDGVRVFNNRTRRHAILFEHCRMSQVRSCVVENYMRIAIDDRTASPDWGYAFNVIHGSGISIRSSKGMLVQGNRIIEHDLIPTKEIKERYKLGDFIKMNPEKGKLLPQKMWDEKYNNAWHQGSAIECRIVNVPNTPFQGSASEFTQILGNYIENAAQGIDIHGDYVTVANNIINDAYMGMKTMHGSSRVIITGNQFVKPALWGIYVSPGAFSMAAQPAGAGGEAQPANPQSATIIANNIISDFGYGNSWWIWKDDSLGSYPIRFDKGQKPETLPVNDVLIQGNIIYDPGRDKILVDGKPVVEPPRYKYAVFVETAPGGPTGLHFRDNLFHPGTQGIANTELKP